VREPEPVAAAVLAELAGCSGITVHLRQDRLHINDNDVYLLRHTVAGSLNLKIAPTAEMVQFAKTVLPNMATLMPEELSELTTEIATAVQNLHSSGILVSLFIEPKIEHVKAARKFGANYVEFNTGFYAEAFERRNESEIESELSKLHDQIGFAIKSGLKVNAGHGLNYRNVKRVAELSGIEELSIGHSIVARAALVGMERAVREMMLLCLSATG